MVAMHILSDNRFARRWAAFVALTLVAFTLLGCPSQQLITEVPTVEDADGQQATCKVARDPLNPLVVEWPGTAKVDLESASRRGLVAVSYAGCTMKILTSCQIEGGYDLESTTPARDRIEISDNNELYAKLPLGAASLKGELSTGSSLELDYIAVGQRVANDSPKASKGDCQDATHFVRTITAAASVVMRLRATCAPKATSTSAQKSPTAPSVVQFCSWALLRSTRTRVRPWPPPGSAPVSIR
jgi:hypothetical protein